jgi:hypothetical protein
MAKTRKRPGRKAKSKKETGSDLSFIGRAIDDAVAQLERRARALPGTAERRVVRSAILAMKLTAKATQLHCGPMWFFMPR